MGTAPQHGLRNQEWHPAHGMDQREMQTRNDTVADRGTKGTATTGHTRLSLKQVQRTLWRPQDLCSAT